MKRLIAIVLAIVLIFSMAACKKRTPGTDSQIGETFSESINNTDSSGNSENSESSENTANTEDAGRTEETGGTQGNTPPSSGGNSGGTNTPVQSTETKDPNVCETADEFIQNMTVGWNLGCSLSVYYEESTAWRALVFFTTTGGVYNRSAAAYFDGSTNTATISWKPGKDDGILQASGSAIISHIGIEIWNFSLNEKDTLTYRIDELKYITANGEVSLNDVTGVKTTDMSGGTGGGRLKTFSDSIAVSDILEVRAKITFIEHTSGLSPEDRITHVETLWGNPVTTPEMIQAVADRGFNTIRPQVSWINHMDENGNIDPYWLERVAEIVDYCMDAGVYCIINTSGAGWMTAERSTFDKQSAVYRRLWEQIATRFAAYGELLLFESCNEVLNAAHSWGNPAVESFSVMHDFHQIFVDTVRAAGGYNATRNLVLNPYAAAPYYYMNRYFTLPNDSVENHLIVQVHCYIPGNFTMNEINLGHTNFQNEWGTDADKAQLDNALLEVKKRFIDELGIPVIIGEFGVVDRPPESERIEYIDFYVKTAKKYGIGLIVFDDGGDFTIFDRDTLTWPYESLVDALLQ